MFYGVINESVLQEGKILDLIKRIFKKKNKNVNASEYIADVQSGIKLFGQNLYIAVKKENKDKIDEYKDKCSHDVQLINKYENEVITKSTKYWNIVLTEELGEDKTDPTFKPVTESDIIFDNCVYNTTYNVYSMDINYKGRDKHMGIYVCCDIRVSEDNKVKIDIFDYDGD
jgi:hypothetical protein